MKTFLLALCGATILPLLPALAAPEPVTLLNVSYDVTRAFYQELNPLFVKDWKDKTGQDVTVTMAHGGSTAEARAVLDGLDADVVTMNQETDIDLLATRSLVSKDWRTEFPNHCAPYTSTMLLLVRNGNPKQIKDWEDLVRPGVKVVVSNPKTSGNGRYAYLAAWGYVLRKNGGDETKARAFVTALFKNIEVLDTGSRAASATFAQHGIGDVLLSFENEINLLRKDPGLGGDKLQIIYPSASILVEPPVAIVNPNVDKHGARPVAQAYLQFLYSPAAQEAVAKNFLRPTDKDVLARHAELFPPVELFDVQTVFGGWPQAQKTHFADGGVLDQIYHP